MSLHNFSCLTARYDRVLVASSPDRRADWAFYLQSVGCNGELVIPELGELALYGDHGGRRLPTIVVAVGPLELPDRILKRMLDLMLTVPAIILLSPLLAAVAIAIKLDSDGPILFKQSRMGQNNRLFEVYKFRSMRHEQSDAAGDRSAARDDDRVTRIGRLIRATSIDELPQLFNVLNGDMALVGPRPHALGSRAGQDLFWQVDSRYWLRHSIKPGITGLAQVRGYRGATDRRADLSNRLYSDLEYLANWSIFRDIAILVRTTTVLIHNKAY
jgi:lipopolysaccharide/colanic/teichoic acid biosynthesis glycosyltransferase